MARRRCFLATAFVHRGTAEDAGEKINNDLLALWRDLRKTVVFVTHSVFESVFLSQRVIVMTARPGRIFAEHRIDAPEPRGESFRTSASYAGFCREVSAMLGQASVQDSGRVA